MADTHRVMIRLSPELYAQLAARGSSGQPLAAIVRHALVQYLAWQPEQPEQPDTIRATVAALRTRLHELQSQVHALRARVDALAAPQQPQAAAEQLQQPPGVCEQPEQPHRAAVAASEQPEQPPHEAPHSLPMHYGRPGLAPETLQAIAEARVCSPNLSMKAFAQLLFDQGIYRGRARDGRPVPADHSRLRRWLDQARRAGLLAEP